MTAQFIPCTPAGTLLVDLAAKTEDAAWRKLMKAAEYMRYRDKAAFIERGYTVWETQPKQVSQIEKRSLEP